VALPSLTYYMCQAMLPLSSPPLRPTVHARGQPHEMWAVPLSPTTAEQNDAMHLRRHANRTPQVSREEGGGRGRETMDGENRPLVAHPLSDAGHR
jgi:hypothetical protein